MQTPKQSLKESIVNTVVGFFVTLIFSPFIYWCCDMPMKPQQIGLATTLFTLLSIARNFIIRRYFNNNKEQADGKLSEYAESDKG